MKGQHCSCVTNISAAEKQHFQLHVGPPALFFFQTQFPQKKHEVNICVSAPAAKWCKSCASECCWVCCSRKDVPDVYSLRSVELIRCEPGCCLFLVSSFSTRPTPREILDKIICRMMMSAGASPRLVITTQILFSHVCCSVSGCF